ncbi:10520_t:CDS:2, partial [Entrophospora sp. SA101]
IIVLTIWIILGLPGFILNLPLIIIARVISAKKAKEAVESSSVKVAGRDVLATWKLLVALVVTPLLYGSYASLRPLFLSLIPSTKSYFQTLREVREQLSYDLTELINELGPKIYPDFDNSRLVREVKGKSRSGSASPSPSRPSSTGLQFSSFLTISDWLSEKNLDWERADDSDYDDVFFFLDQQNGKITGRSRSNSRTRIKDQGSRSRSSSIGSNNDGGLGSNGNTIGIEPLSTVDQSPEIERNRSDLSLPKFTFKDCDEDSGYHGDKEYDDKIETKKELELPSNLKSLASDKSTNDHNDNELSSDSDSPLQGYWQINNMLEFENIIFSKTVEETGIKYLFCANCINCDLEPLGIHDTNENNSNNDDLIQEAGIFLLATHKGSYDIGEDVISKK